MKRTMSTAPANMPFASLTYSTTGGVPSECAAVTDEDLELVADVLRAQVVHLGAGERRLRRLVIVRGHGGSAGGQLLADLPQAGRGRVVERGRRGLHGLALDEVLAGDAVDVG